MNVVQQKKWNPSLLLVIVVYLVANLVTIFNQGVFWDDWTVYNTSYASLETHFNGNGLKHLTYLHHYLQQLPNPAFGYRILTIFLELSIIRIIWALLKNFKLHQTSSFYLSLIVFACIPYFAAKNTMICFPYTLSLFCFCLGSYIMIVDKARSFMILRILSILLLFFSFFVNSLIFFYIIPFFILYCIKANRNIQDVPFSLKSVKRFIHIDYRTLFRLTDFILLPFIFFIVKSLFFKTSGIYAAQDYNKLSLIGLIKAIPLSIKSLILFSLNLFEEINLRISIDKELLLLLPVIFLLIYYSIKKTNLSPTPNSSVLYVLLSGALIYLIGVFPYAAVGKLPGFSAYSTRHQLLLPFGASLILVALTQILFKKRFEVYIISGIISFFVITTLQQNIQFIRGSLKNESIMLNMTEFSTIKNNDTFLFVDYAEDLTATTDKKYSFHVLNGIAKKAFDSQTRLLVSYDQYELNKLFSEESPTYLEKEKYNMKDYEVSDLDYLIKIDENTKLPITEISRLLFLKQTNKKQYQLRTKKILTISILEIDQESIEFFLERND